MSNLKIYEAISAIMRDLEAVPKSKQSTGGGANYKYRSIDQLYTATQKVMAKHGVFTVPKRLTRVDSTFQTKSGTTMSHAVITFEYRFYASDGSFIEVILDGEGMDTSDKVSGKCASYAHKYALIQVFCIPTEEADDPDSMTHEPIIETKKRLPPQNITKFTKPFEDKSFDLNQDDGWPKAQENNLVIGLRDLVKAQQDLNLEASQVSEIIKEVTGKDRSGDCTKPELTIILQTLRDRFGK